MNSILVKIIGLVLLIIILSGMLFIAAAKYGEAQVINKCNEYFEKSEKIKYDNGLDFINTYNLSNFVFIK